MRANLALGLTQGILLPHAPARPERGWRALGDRLPRTPSRSSCASALSASAMWAANAATVSPAPDTADGRCHLTVANLVTMPHRSHEWPGTLAQLRLAFADDDAFAVHGPVPAPFGDEGAANHMRLCDAHGTPGVEVFVYGVGGGPFPARQHREASAAIARRHGSIPRARCSSSHPTKRSPRARSTTTSSRSPTSACCSRTNTPSPTSSASTPDLRERLPEVEIVEVPAERGQPRRRDRLLPVQRAARHAARRRHGADPADRGARAPVASGNGWRRWSPATARSGGSMPVDVRQSMANGGGPACLRLRVVCRSGDGRSALPGGRCQARPTRRRDRGVLA